MKTTTPLLFLATLLILPCFVFGQSRDTIKERKIEQQLMALDSSAVPLFKAATVELDQEHYSFADSLYTLVCEKVPNFDHAIRRLGVTKMSAAKPKEAIDLCEKAVSINRSYSNIITLATIYIRASSSADGVITPYLSKAKDLLAECQKLPDAEEKEYMPYYAQIALQLNQIDEFKTVSKTLLERHPDLMSSHYYGAVAAALNEDWAAAENEIQIAKSMGLPEEDVEQFLDSGVRSKASTDKYMHWGLWIFLFWAIGFVVLYVVGVILSSYTLRSVEKEFKNNADTKLAHSLRGFYRLLINVAGVYYYISLPVILILVVALVIGIFYLFLMIGRIPIQLMLILLIGSVFTIYSMIRSLMVKVNTTDPGRELKPSEAPGLYALTKEVADTMGTRPIDEIRITAETDLAVYEKGTWKEKFQDKGKRILILGTGVLKEFKQNDFKAVIAHEYGHFSNRDTAGGAVALRVRRDMHKYVFALYTAGQTVWWNLAFQFLRLYDFIFHSISNGATRLQEVLADRVAAQTYGAQAFQNGLTYVIKRNIEFVKLANVEIQDARKIKRPFNNLYELAPDANVSIEEELKKALNRETTNEDTHPSPADRFRFIEGLGVGKSIDNNKYIRDLFVNWAGITDEMTKEIEDSWKKHGTD